MYFLWRNKPHAVLGLDGEWIPKGEIQAKINEVMVFPDAGQARYIQRTKYSKSGVSVLNQKSFKEKARIKKFPVNKTTVGTDSHPKPEERQQKATKRVDNPCVYGEYLDRLCDADFGQRSRVVIPPSNLEVTTNTPSMQKIKSIFSELLDRITTLEDREHQLAKEIKQLDLLNSDRLHMVEMYDLTEEECVSFVRDLHESQIERRRRKNELIAVFAEKNILQKLSKDELKQALKTITTLGQQEYHCRVLPENDPIIEGHQRRLKERSDTHA